MSANPDVVDIRGTEYTVVAARLRKFREEHPDWTVMTDFVSDESGRVVVKATIADHEQRVIATGYAEEERGSTNVNSTSALENCETSAVGRALGFVHGEYAGNTIRSGDEMINALVQQNEKQMWAANRAFLDAFELHYDSIKAIREFLADDNFDAAKEAMNEIPNEDKMALNRAWTKGGAFNPRETRQIKYWSNDFEISAKTGERL
jgi:hypothetical protein